MANTKNEPTNPVGHALPAEYLLRHFELDPRLAATYVVNAALVYLGGV